MIPESRVRPLPAWDLQNYGTESDLLRQDSTSRPSWGVTTVRGQRR